MLSRPMSLVPLLGREGRTGLVRAVGLSVLYAVAKVLALLQQNVDPIR
jgi:hypothetical protein